MMKFLNDLDILCILLNSQRVICYSNVSKTIAGEYISKIHLFNYFPFDDNISYETKDYRVIIYKISLKKLEYYLAIIRYKDNLYKYAYLDNLTGLYNRNYWEKLKTSILKTYLSKRFFLIIVDIDGLKLINDRKGHLEGDRVIRIVGQSIKECIREDDIGFRYGGDEFFILVSTDKSYVADIIINRIRKRIKEKCNIENISVRISAGKAYYDFSCELDKVIIMADEDMYREKNKKKTTLQNLEKNVNDLEKEIEDIRNKLNYKLMGISEMLNYSEIVKLSIKLDKLITKYIKYKTVISQQKVDN